MAEKYIERCMVSRRIGQVAGYTDGKEHLLPHVEGPPQLRAPQYVVCHVKACLPRWDPHTVSPLQIVLSWRRVLHLGLQSPLMPVRPIALLALLGCDVLSCAECALLWLNSWVLRAIQAMGCCTPRLLTELSPLATAGQRLAVVNGDVQMPIPSCGAVVYQSHL